MRAQMIRIAGGGRVAVDCDAAAQRARLELPAGGTSGSATALFSAGELLMTIEALSMAYAELCGARPESAARGVNRVLRNRTRSARERAAGAANR